MTQEHKKRIGNILMIILILGFLFLFYQCPFRFLLGIPCPGCGMTRAFLALLHLDIKDAFHAHPLFPVVILIAIYYLLETIKVIRFPEKVKKILLVVIALLFILVYVVRLCHGSEIVQICPENALLYQMITYIKQI